MVLRVPAPSGRPLLPLSGIGAVWETSHRLYSLQIYLRFGSETFYQDFDADIHPGLPPRSLIRGSSGPVALGGVRGLGGNGGARADQSYTRRERDVSQSDRTTCSACARALGTWQGKKGRENGMRASRKNRHECEICWN